MYRRYNDKKPYAQKRTVTIGTRHPRHMSDWHGRHVVSQINYMGVVA